METSRFFRMRLSANLTLLFVTFVWGATFSLTKGALASVPVFAYLAVRFTIASLILIVILLMTRTARKSLNRRSLRLGILLGGLLFGAYGLQTLGLQYTSPATAGFLTGLSVILVPVLGYPLLKIKPQAKTWAGASTAMVGLGLLCGIELLQFQVGDILVLMCAVFVALQVLLIEKYGQQTDSLALATVEIVTLTLLSWIATIFDRPTIHSFSAWLDPSVVWALLICAIPGTAIAYWAQNAFQKHTSSTQTAIIFSMEPVFAALIGWWLLHDALTTREAVGCLLIFLSMLLAEPGFHLKPLRNRVSL
jgi:drug/metabolite transporter (DMT)-like permease